MWRHRAAQPSTEQPLKQVSEKGRRKKTPRTCSLAQDPPHSTAAGEAGAESHQQRTASVAPATAAPTRPRLLSVPALSSGFQAHVERIMAGSRSRVPTAAADRRQPAPGSRQAPSRIQVPHASHDCKADTEQQQIVQRAAQVRCLLPSSPSC